MPGAEPEGSDSGRRRWPSQGSVCAGRFFDWCLGIVSGVNGEVMAASDRDDRLEGTVDVVRGAGGGNRELDATVEVGEGEEVRGESPWVCTGGSERLDGGG